MRCRRLVDKVMKTEEWLARHREHGELSTERFPHPSGRWYWLVCECGAKHLTSTDDQEARHGVRA